MIGIDRNPDIALFCMGPWAVRSSSPPVPHLLGSKKPGPQGQDRDQWLCPYQSTGVMEYWSIGVLVLKKKIFKLSDFLQGSVN